MLRCHERAVSDAHVVVLSGAITFDTIGSPMAGRSPGGVCGATIPSTRISALLGEDRQVERSGARARGNQVVAHKGELLRGLAGLLHVLPEVLDGFHGVTGFELREPSSASVSTCGWRAYA